MGISYGDSPEKAIQIIQSTLKASPKVIQNPLPQVGIENFGESSIDISMRYWVPTSEYYLALFSVNLAVFKALQEAKITIPFPQREVRMVTK